VSRDVATLFRILQRHYPQFMETVKFQIDSRREFGLLLASNPDTLTDLERAGRFRSIPLPPTPRKSASTRSTRTPDIASGMYASMRRAARRS
jgi:hypothetical protein